MYDSHCHLDDALYDHDREAVIARAEAAGVVGILVPGFQPSEWAGLGRVCALHPALRCAVGLHPWYLHTLSDAARTHALSELPEVLRAQGAVAVGECGLDKPKSKSDGTPLALQRAVLERHVEVARVLSLPLVLHCVQAHPLMLEVLERHGALPAGGVLHSYSGPAELVPRYLALGLSFSFAGILTRANAQRPKRALGAVPLARLLVESDGPDQAVAAVHPGRSEPAHVAWVLEAMATLRPESLAELACATTSNAQRLFDGGLPYKPASAR